MSRTDCTRAEVLAGAVALGEASDSERDAYRRHLSGCARCIGSLGGERDIERVMLAVAQARESETWEPATGVALGERGRTKRHAWGFGLSAIAAATIVSIGIHAIVAAGVTRIGLTPENPVVIDYDGQRITLEHRAPTPARVARAVPAARNLVVVHNVVTLTRPPVAARSALAASRNAVPARVAAAAAVDRSAGLAGDPTLVAVSNPSQRDKHSIVALRTGAETAPPSEQRAESIAVVPQTVVVRDAMPVGGEGAIVPHPSSVAYDENAEGTTAFEVTVDERGVPIKCSITKPSGYVVLDLAVCRAAMHVRYSPRTLNGRAVAGLYHDAFTFRTSSDSDTWSGTSLLPVPSRPPHGPPR